MLFAIATFRTSKRAMAQAAFDPRVLASVCFFATDIHSATLGKGKKDDTLIRVQNGALVGKGELVVRTRPVYPLLIHYLVHIDDLWETGRLSHSP